jgi:PAS domain S-box-containing protein
LLQLLESSTDFIGVIDPYGRGIFINRAAKEMIGIDGDLDTMARDFTSFFFEEDLPFVKDVILATTKNKGQWVGDFRFRHVKTGKAVLVHYNSFTTHDESTGEFTGYATVSRDMTDIKNKERKLEEALKARDQFLSMASHELKTPLTSLKLQAQLNLRNLENHKSIPIETQMTQAHQANQTIGRLVKLIDDMLDVSRIRTGKLKLDKQDHELGDIVREVVQRMSLLFESAGLQIPPTQFREKIHGHWDRFRLEQVIGNLLTNAIKYGRHKPVEICIRKNKTHAILTVKDHGYGIAQEDLKKIFDRFERGVHFAEVSGLGLGLFISKEIVRSHGGHILVESRLDVGSTFTISLPLKLESSQM